VCTMTGIFAKYSGLTNLAQRYPVTQLPTGAMLIKQTVKVGAVRYRRCVDVSIGEGGLYLGVHPPLLKQGDMLIPWEEIKGAQKTRLYSRKAVRLSIGEPEFGSVALYKALYEQVVPYLQSSVPHPL
jgi:hypothetical protein